MDRRFSHIPHTNSHYLCTVRKNSAPCVYKNDFSEYIKLSTLLLFADDNIIYTNQYEIKKLHKNYIGSKMGVRPAHVIPSSTCSVL